MTTPNFQSISAIKHEGSFGEQTVVCVSKGEIVANWRCAAKLAEKEGMHGTAERLRNDANFLETLKPDDIVRIVA